MTEHRGTQPSEAKGTVIAFSAPGCEPLYAHEREAMAAVARTIASLKGFAFQQGLGNSGGNGLYFVPDDSLLAPDAARLGINGPQDLFGGVVPWRFAMTKAITHELVDGLAKRPKEWSTGFGRTVSAAVLPGYTVFSRHDALRAAERLLRLGQARLKPPLSSRGQDQHIVRTVADVEGLLERYRFLDLDESGLVLEADLRDIVTLSVGRTEIDEIRVAYYGSQRTTTDNAGQSVYGGSDLIVVRGGWEALQDLQLPRALALATAQAKAYDAATAGYPGFFASAQLRYRPGGRLVGYLAIRRARSQLAYWRQQYCRACGNKNHEARPGHPTRPCVRS